MLNQLQKMSAEKPEMGFKLMPDQSETLTENEVAVIFLNLRGLEHSAVAALC